MSRIQFSSLLIRWSILGCWLVAMSGVCQATPSFIHDQDDSTPERIVLIKSVSLLRSVDRELVASAPTDLIIKDGVIHEIGDDLDSKVSSSTYRLRRPGRWLLASPVGYVAESGDHAIFFDDLIHAGLMGFGALIVEADPEYVDIIKRRALLESKAVPRIISRKSKSLPAHVLEFSRSDDITLFSKGLSEQNDVLSASALRDDDPFRQGATANFLLLSEDPRVNREVIANPDAVLVGGEVILQSERLVRLEEHDRFDPALLHSFGSVPLLSKSDRLIYEVIISGIPRGVIRLQIETLGQGRMRLDLDGVTTSPTSGSSKTTLAWPEGTVTHREVIQEHVFECSFKTSAQGGQLAIISDGEPLPESPIQLEVGDRYLPDTLLILLDALWNPTHGLTRRVVEVDVSGGPVSVHWSIWHPLVDVSAEKGKPTPLGMTPTELLLLAGAKGGQLMALSPSGSASRTVWVALDRQKRLVWALYPAPFGMTEWRLRTPQP
jgi:hypothetical protein